MLTAEPRLDLGPRPAHLEEVPVAVWREPLIIDSYLPAPPSRYPAYLDRRVYQGSSGRVYPLPFHHRIDPERRPVEWDAVHLENRWLRVMVLPELGGRIHIGLDRTSGYDFFYRASTIKPALVGLAGPWIAGGVELNWPQHHRPATFLPVDVSIEQEEDGAVTVWCSDHDPFTRMKGMHGVRLHPDRAVVELRVRLYNRTELTQTFLWWANAAARVHQDYQSFFPRDVRLVADHAKRAVTAFPAADRPYYGIDYPARRDDVGRAAGGIPVPGDRLDWYRNIPVPTSYMALHSDEDFFGGYDHAAGAGFVHVADHHVAVGKKQWTWGAEAFGRAWDANLADDGAAYVELMAGVYTDNQPDFSFIAPGETKVFSQYWYPIQQIGPVHSATTEGALRVDLEGGTAPRLRVGAVVTRERAGCRIEVQAASGETIGSVDADLAPGRPYRGDIPLTAVTDEPVVRLLHDGEELASCGATADRANVEGTDEVAPAREPAPAPDVASVEELALIGRHLQQYRHATRSPEPYWREALRRDPGHVDSAVGLAERAYRRGDYIEAERLLRTAVERLTALNPNPADTTALYLLGLVLEGRGDPDGAYDAFARSSWTRAWRAPAGYRMARIDAGARRDRAALERLGDVLRTEPEHLQARALRVLVLDRLGHHDAARADARATSALDPLDWWTRDLLGMPLECDAQTCLDVALEHAAVGEHDAALRALDRAHERERYRAAGQPAAGPVIEYHRARILQDAGDREGAAAARRTARAMDAAYCFPSRLEDARALDDACHADPDDPRARALLGHWLYARERHDDAIAAWRASAAADPNDPVVLRNLGLALYNHAGDAAAAREAYDQALRLADDDPQLRYESDQLDARLGVLPARRLQALLEHPETVARRDDATVELAHLLVTAGRLDEANRLLTGRRFQPWEGGEGVVLRAWERLCEARARRHLATTGREGRPNVPAFEAAVSDVEAALAPPSNLGEARHPLANTARLHLLLGDALAAAGRRDTARRAWETAASQEGDFLSMATHDYSEATCYSVLALRRLGRADEAARLADELRRYRDRLAESRAEADYFATSLPSLLLFTEDPDVAQRRRVELLGAQLDLLAGDVPAARSRLEAILAADPNHLDATDLATDPAATLDGPPTH